MRVLRTGGATVRYDLTVVGAGFAGALLARLVALAGRRVLLVERDRHPRFALGESSTPLAALCLERLSRRYQQPDLHALAAHGRWRRRLPELGCGLKRGFTFYRHHPHHPFPHHHGADRFLVAASPDDESADCQWMRADVDAMLVERARQAGADYRDRCTVIGATAHARGLRLEARTEGRNEAIDTRFVVDASGAGGTLAETLGAGAGTAVPFSSRLIYGHFDGVRPFADTTTGHGASLPPGPYPDDWAAVHHLLDEGWIYALRFDTGIVSAGLVVDSDPEGAAGQPESLWKAILGRYPTLAASFADARPRPPGLRSINRLQYRRRRAAGPRWALLPNAFAFFDPMFSTGIAWSLLAVERLAGLLGAHTPPRAELERYARLLDREADQQQALLDAAYAARRDLSVFRELSFLYFACASYEELRQRLNPGHGALPGLDVAWGGFLGADTPPWPRLFRQARSQVDAALGHPSAEARGRFASWVQSGISHHNLVGLGESHDHLYGVDTELLRARSSLLGLTPEQLEARLPLLRGGDPR